MSDAPDWTIPTSIRAQEIETVKVDISAQSVGNLDVNIASQSTSLNVQGDVNVTNDQLNVNVTNSELNVNVTNSELDVNVTGTTDVNIAQASVYLNVKQDPATENSIVLQNDGTPSGYSPRVLRGAKIFPRGARGYIDKVSFYIQPGTVNSTFDVELKATLDGPAIYNYTLSVPAGGATDWYDIQVSKFWNYDSIVVTIMRTSGDARVARDDQQPYDQYHFDPDVGYWEKDDQRMYARVYLWQVGQGDIPVSGTVNTINMPNMSSFFGSTGVYIGTEQTVTLVDIEGAGRVKFMSVHMYGDAATVAYLRIIIDDVTILDDTVLNIHLYLGEQTGGSGDKMYFAQYDTANNTFVLRFNDVFEFRKSFRIDIYNPNDTFDMYARHTTIVNMLR